jgi:hypothetical protein
MRELGNSLRLLLENEIAIPLVVYFTLNFLEWIIQ